MDTLNRVLWYNSFYFYRSTVVKSYRVSALRQACMLAKSVERSMHK
jgi:hypothetical protein